MRSMYFGKDFDGKEDKYYHAEHSNMDYSLCGMGNVEVSIYSDHKITCPQCIEVIEFCKTFKKDTDYKPTKEKSK